MAKDRYNYTVKVVEQSRVSPPPGTVAGTSLPLTFFDVPWLLCRHMQRLYFYRFSGLSLDHFSQTLVPSLKHSLSLTLLHFFPFAASLATPPPPEQPCIVYAAGDFLSFTVAESDGDFDRLTVIDECSRDVREIHAFVPELTPTRVEGLTRVAPLMALQITLFPDKGICIGVRFCHVAADGRSFHHFMKSWSSICKTQVPIPQTQIPYHNRAVIKDPNGLGPIFLKDWWAVYSTWDQNAGPENNSLVEKVRATIVLGQAQIENLKRWVRLKLNDIQRTYNDVLSSFVVTCALIWVCLVKSDQDHENDNNKRCHFVFVADCRGDRLEFDVPTTYFGNCLSLCFVELKRSELVGEEAMVSAAKAIAERIIRLRERGYLEEAENWVSKWKNVAALGERVITVAGSAKLNIYEADFGFGRPTRTESVQVDVSDSFSLAESHRIDDDGVEIGLALTRDKMLRFNHVLEHSLRLSSDHTID